MANTTGVPPAGVTCVTSQESAHVVENGTLTSAVTLASGLIKYVGFGVQTASLYPRPFFTDYLGMDATNHTYTIEYATGCDISRQQLWYAPIGYQDASGKNYSSPNYDAAPGSSLVPASPISSDIILFAYPLEGPSIFCAVLTNSDADPSDQLYVEEIDPVEGGNSLTLNDEPAGYHQCNTN